MSPLTAIPDTLYNLDHPNWESALKTVIQKYIEGSSSTAAQLNETILKLGHHILTKGTSEQQINLLDLGCNRAFTQTLQTRGLTEEWFRLEGELIQALQFTPGRLFGLRVQQFPHKTLFRYQGNYQWQKITWSEAAEMAQRFAGGLLRLMNNNPGPVAAISENRIEVAICDLACLTYGILNVPIQPALPPHQLGYILDHAEIETVVISNTSVFNRFQAASKYQSSVKHIIALDKLPAAGTQRQSSWSDLQQRLGEAEKKQLEDRRSQVRLDATATYMYTSGTTGNPKAIQFTYANIITKRFARALVFPVDKNDVFLAFLPFYHTFGRYLELWGCIFWGAAYNFANGTNLQNLLTDMQIIRPTVFISIPRRWQEIYERIITQYDPLQTSRLELRNRLHDLLGNRLRIGLSAAGFLAPEVFQFFQKHEIQLLSGYGMTEGTGGITMTLPGNYVPNSVGLPLPGIEVKIAEDGELLIRGPYVSPGYYKPDFEDSRPGGWVGTGDIFRKLPQHHLEIIDRKKEIYKNTKGQTIAPQKIENLFQDFEAVQQIFLVGDHRPFNTALIFPNYIFPPVAVILGNPEQLNAYFASLVNSVNTFLAPFERIVNFVLIDRAFSTNLNEITPKGTYKRHVVLENFKRDIDRLYEKPYQTVFIGKLEVRVPMWFLLDRGWARDDLQATPEGLTHATEELTLPIAYKPGALLLGNLYYQFENTLLDLDLFIRQPAYWIGNESFLKFIGYDDLPTKNFNQTPVFYPGQWQSPEFTGSETVDITGNLTKHLNENTFDFFTLHKALCLLFSTGKGHGNIAFQYLVRAARQAGANHQSTIYYAFLRLIRAPHANLRQAAFQQALSMCNILELNKLLDYALRTEVLIELDSEGFEEWPNVNKQKLAGLLNIAKQELLTGREAETLALNSYCQNLLTLLTAVGIAYPQYYSGIRSELVRWQINCQANSAWSEYLGNLHNTLVTAFRARLVPPANMATSPDTDQSYGWRDVIHFAPEVTAAHQHRIRHCLSTTPVVNEALFLFYHGRSLRLQEIPPDGINVFLLGAGHAKVVYRIEVQTRELDIYNFAININVNRPKSALEAEVRWLQASTSLSGDEKIVEDFGGYYGEDELWTEEFIPGKTVEQHLRMLKEGRLDESSPPAAFLWPHFVWTGIGAYYSFWRQTQFQVFVKDPTPANINIPPHDYYRGGRIISISTRIRNQTPLQLLLRVYKRYITETERFFPDINAYLKPAMVFSPIYEALGPLEGKKYLEAAAGDTACPEEMQQQIQDFLDEIEMQGFCPKPVFFAILRYQRWLKLNPGATLKAQGRYILELLKDYNIRDSSKVYPDARLRFFLDTVFAEASLVVRGHLRSWMSQQRELSLPDSRLQWEIRELLTNHEHSESEIYFLKRLPLPYLSGADSIEIIANPQTGMQDVEIMVSRRDQKGKIFHIRKPINPKEILRLHRLFSEVNLEVQFRAEHEYLLALNENGHVIGGLFYEPVDAANVFMDKIVVSGTYTGRGVSRALMDEFFDRMRSRGFDVVTTGFYQPSYFSKLSFRVEKQYDGLVKQLN